MAKRGVHCVVLCAAALVAMGAVTCTQAQVYNRSLDVADVRLEINPEPAPDRPFMITGFVHYGAELSPDVSLDLSCAISIWVNGEYVGGGGSGGGCGDPGTTQKVVFGYGLPVSGNPPLFDCALFCSTCLGFDINICTPPSVSPGPVCMCQQECIPFRVTGFGVPVGALSPDDIIEISLAVYDAGLPEIDTSDDSIALLASAILPCLADTNHDGTLSPADFTAWIAAFNAGAPECDQNSDGLCTPADFTAWIANYNAGC